MFNLLKVIGLTGTSLVHRSSSIMSGRKLAEIRSHMANLPVTKDSVQAYIVPTDDQHQSEYISAHDCRREYISGFTGSAGTAVVMETEARLWTDGRYWEQADKELEAGWTLMRDGLATTLSIGKYLAKHLPAGSKVGVDPLMMSFRMWNTISTDLAANDCHLHSVRKNLVDEVWIDQPKQTNNKAISLDLKFCGESIESKVAKIREQMKDRDSSAMVVTALDEIAWFLNIRGSDIPYNPVFFSYLIITETEIFLYINNAQLPDDWTEHLRHNAVSVIVKEYDCAEEDIMELQGKLKEKVWISPTSNYLMNSLIDDKKRHQEITAINTAKAIKNSVEVSGLRLCHQRDGKALCQYFAWLENELNAGRKVTEVTGADKLEELRSKLDHFMGLSFTCISAFGANGSIIHYSPKRDGEQHAITKDNLYLCDSGAQFLDGTTDVTRTWHFGEPTAFQKECFTRVLKGQINMGTAVFPTKCGGFRLDSMARKFLWDVGLDYAHGTGHGIGHFLNVHEGPMGVGIRPATDEPGLQAGMFISNEPGYYKTGEFGIRIEDIVHVVPATVPYDFNGLGALTFETVTMCPIHTKLIDSSIMTDTEVNHLNAYHKKVLEIVGPQLEADGDTFTLEWLKRETQPIEKWAMVYTV